MAPDLKSSEIAYGGKLQLTNVQKTIWSQKNRLFACKRQREEEFAGVFELRLSDEIPIFEQRDCEALRRLENNVWLFCARHDLLALVDLHRRLAEAHKKTPPLRGAAPHLFPVPTKANNSQAPVLKPTYENNGRGRLHFLHRLLNRNTRHNQKLGFDLEYSHCVMFLAFIWKYSCVRVYAIRMKALA